MLKRFRKNLATLIIAKVDLSEGRILGRLSNLEAQMRRLQHAGEKQAYGQNTAYLDLLEKVLPGTLCSWEARPDDTAKQLRELGRDWPKRAFTMVGAVRLKNLRMLLEDVIQNNIPGDFIETGVWRGGSCIFAKAVFESYSQTDRNVWVADSFAGLPEPNEEKYPHDKGDKHYTNPRLAINEETVRENFRQFNLLDDNVRFLKGWFKDTLPQAPIEQLAILRLDGDMYESTMDALNALYHKVSDGGYIIVDDYKLKPCAQAITDFWEAHNITDELIHIDGTAAYWQKNSAEVKKKVV